MDVKNPLFSMSEDGEFVRAHLTEDGRKENTDDTPVAPPLGYRHGSSLSDTVMEMLRRQRQRELQDAYDEELETLEEADDFDVGDDFDPTSPFEDRFNPPAKPMTEEQRNAEIAVHLKKVFPGREADVDAFLKGVVPPPPPADKPAPEPAKAQEPAVPPAK